jgi:hypothetical protein
MRIFDVVTESLSRVAFHYTHISTALKILQSGNFELSSALGSIEQQYMIKGKPYFMSTTRTRRGGYHENAGRTQGVLFVLDGNWFNQNYASRPLDYWENRDPLKYHHRTHEAEDRIYSAEPTIPISGVSAIHVLYTVEEDNPPKTTLDSNNLAMVRQILISAKTQGIPAYFYTDKAAWQNMDTRHLGDVSILTGQRDPSWYRPKRKRGYMQNWIELMMINDIAKLSPEARTMMRGLGYGYNRNDAKDSLYTDIGNARKPDSGQERADAVKIIAYMRQNGLGTIKEFVDHIAEKWKAILDKSEQ